MFVHIATLYFVKAAAADAFVRSIRLGGDWQRLARRVAPDLVASDLLQHQASSTPMFLCLDFWVSWEKYLCVRESPVYDPLFTLRHQLAVATIQLGAFSFPAPAEADATLPQAEDLCTRPESREAR